MPPTPVSEYLQRLHAEIAGRRDGAVATYIPELATADPDRFGIAVATLDGSTYAAGDADTAFTIQSVSKPFVMALAIRDRGVEAFLAAVGVEPTGDPFNAVTLEEGTGRPLNPMVNAGAILTSSLVGGARPEERAGRIVAGLSAFAGRSLDVDERVYASELATADRNRALVYLMRSMGAFDADVEEALAVYCQQCAVNVSARDLAVMAATLANGGSNPVTGEQVVEPDVVTAVLSVMVTCGLYDGSGDWMFRTGIPAKSGVGGGISAVLPGQLGIGTFSPRLDPQGNSVRGVAACEALSSNLGLHVMRPLARGAGALHRRLAGASVRSHRGRRAAERAVLASSASIVLYELQGGLGFQEAELVARRASQESCRWLVLDVARVDSVEPVGQRLLDAEFALLAASGVTVLLGGPWPVPVPRSVRVLGSASDAVLQCEEVLIAEAGLPAADQPVPLADNDLCRGMSAADVEALREHGRPLRLAAGESVADAYALLLITRGVLALESGSADDDAGGAGGTTYALTTRGAGTAVGSATLPSGAAHPHLVAPIDAEAVALTVGQLHALEGSLPHLAAMLYRNAVQMVAVEYRWSASEQAAAHQRP